MIGVFDLQHAMSSAKRRHQRVVVMRVRGADDDERSLLRFGDRRVEPGERRRQPHQRRVGPQRHQVRKRVRAERMVLCDVSLPDGTGVELHQRVKPELQSRFVFSTKGVLAADVAEYLRSSSCPTLLRPIAPEEIRSLLSDDDDGISGAPTLIGTRRRDTNPNLFNPARDRQSARSAQRRRTATQTDTPIAKTRSRPPERS